MGASEEGFPPISYSDWRRRVDSELRGADFATALTSTGSEGFSVDPLFTSKYPTQSTSRDSVSWSRSRTGSLDRWKESQGSTSGSRVLCQEYGDDDPVEINRRLRGDLAGGSTGAWLHLGAKGSAISSLEGFHVATKKLPIAPSLWMFSVEGDLAASAALASEVFEGRMESAGDPTVVLRLDPLSGLAEAASASSGLDEAMGVLARLSSASGSGLRSLGPLSFRQLPWMRVVRAWFKSSAWQRLRQPGTFATSKTKGWRRPPQRHSWASPLVSVARSSQKLPSCVQSASFGAGFFWKRALPSCQNLGSTSFAALVGRLWRLRRGDICCEARHPLSLRSREVPMSSARFPLPWETDRTKIVWLEISS